VLVVLQEKEEVQEKQDLQEQQDLLEVKANKVFKVSRE
jgi:hypothetical protein